MKRYVNRREFMEVMVTSAAAMYMCGYCKAAGMSSQQAKNRNILTSIPPMGWNSFDCYGNCANERVMLENIDTFAEKLKPHGYEYVVFDCGWFSNHEIPKGEEFPRSDSLDAKTITIDEFGRCIPAKTPLPNGLKPLIDHAHSKGVKFGVWLIRGIPRQAVDANLPIKGTPYRAQDIANVENTCRWCNFNYGIDLDKPGAQEYYNSVIQLIASWGVDFVKYDDIVPWPHDIEAVAKAIDNCGEDIVLSLSPGDEIHVEHVDSYRKADMLRITGDVWDRRESLTKVFERWEIMQDFGGHGFWLDFDMIPFGHLKVWNPQVEGRKGWGNVENDGFAHMDNFSLDQKQTFMTQRALGASPLMMGGDLPTTDELSIKLITHGPMLECNHNGVTGKLITRNGETDIWGAPHKSKKNCGWIGVFNRSKSERLVRITKKQLGLKPLMEYKFTDVWRGHKIKESKEFEFALDADGVAFLKYEKT